MREPSRRHCPREPSVQRNIALHAHAQISKVTCIERDANTYAPTRIHAYAPPHTCTHACTCLRGCRCKFTSMCTHSHAHAHACRHASTYTYAYTYTYTSKPTRTPAHMSTYTCMCVHDCTLLLTPSNSLRFPSARRTISDPHMAYCTRWYNIYILQTCCLATYAYPPAYTIFSKQMPDAVQHMP